MLHLVCKLRATNSYVHIGDRKSEIYESFRELEFLATKFCCATVRIVAPASIPWTKQGKNSRSKAVHRVEVRNDKYKSNVSTELLDNKYHMITLCPSVGKEKCCCNLKLTVIHTIERGQPEGLKPIKWKVITNLPVKCKADMIEKLDWYALQWKIDVFHKVLKSACPPEDSNYETLSGWRT